MKSRILMRARVGIALVAAWMGSCGDGMSLDPTSKGRAAPDSAREHDPDGANTKTASDAPVLDVDGGSAKGALADASSDVSPMSEAATRDSGARESSADVSSEALIDGSLDISIGADVSWNADAQSDVSSADRAIFGDTIADVAGERRELDALDACTVACGPIGYDYYVDAHVDPSGDGSRERPFSTITAAVDAFAAVPGRPKKAHVAPGTYDAALGERFPLLLRGLSLEGAGQDQTFIVGSGPLDHAGEGGVLNRRYAVTMVIGDRALPTQISAVSVRPSIPAPTPDYYGVFCDRGNATGDVASPNGQSRLDGVTVGPGYDTNVVVTTSTIPADTGCDLLITRSKLTGGWQGIHAKGCDDMTASGAVILEMGTEETTSGNTVSWMVAPDGSGSGVIAESCVVRAAFRNNAFVDSTIGVALFEWFVDPDAGRPPHSVVFQRNTFQRLTRRGISYFAPLAFIEEISDNRFIEISQAANQTADSACGLCIYDSRVGRVRRNHFIGNDIAVAMYDSARADFGTAADPGNNVFRCNSRTDTVATSDVAVFFSDPPIPPDRHAWQDPVHLSGNLWDHAPPTFSASEQAPNGTDVWIRKGPSLDLDLTNASLATADCPSGRVPGP